MAVTMKWDKAAHQKLVKALQEDLVKNMEYIVGLGAQYERLNHKYTNRTGNLERSTKAVWVVKNSNELKINLEMGMEYASSVRNLGYSSIDTAAKQVEYALLEYFDTIFDKYPQ